MTTAAAREKLKARLNDLVMGHNAPDGTYVQGVVDFRDDDVDLDRLADGVMELWAEIARARVEAGS